MRYLTVALARILTCEDHSTRIEVGLMDIEDLPSVTLRRSGMSPGTALGFFWALGGL